MAGALVFLLTVLLIVFLFPFKLTVVPPWPLRVFDETGSPVRATNVTEHWQHYDFETEGHEEVRQTDDSGQVDFPERSIRINLLSRIITGFNDWRGRPLNPRSDPYGSLVVWGNPALEVGIAVYEPETAPPEQLRVRRR